MIFEDQAFVNLIFFLTQVLVTLHTVKSSPEIEFSSRIFYPLSSMDDYEMNCIEPYKTVIY